MFDTIVSRGQPSNIIQFLSFFFFCFVDYQEIKNCDFLFNILLRAVQTLDTVYVR
jgi:hypothetical protein